MGEEDQERGRSRWDNKNVESDDGGEGNVVARNYGIWDMVQVYMPTEKSFRRYQPSVFLLFPWARYREQPAMLLLDCWFMWQLTWTVWLVRVEGLLGGGGKGLYPLYGAEGFQVIFW